MRGLLLNGYINKNIVNYGLLNLSDKGEEFLKKPTKFEIAVDQKFERYPDDDDAGVEVENIFDEILFDMLKDLTKKVSKQLNLPPYIIFTDPSLEEMAFKYPITIDELSKVIGVNKSKAIKYGKQFIELIKKYVDEKGIERPEDFVVKSVVNKSAKKITIITNIDKKMGLDDIACSLGINREELLKEIENIIFSGTKLSLKTYVNDMMDDDQQEEMMDYFRGTQVDSIDEIIKEYGEDFSKDELQLLRLHFISETAF